MGSFFNDAALIEHQNPIRFLNRAQPVRDDEGRPFLHQPVQRLLHE